MVSPMQLDTIKRYTEAGLHLFPVKENSKQPACAWKRYELEQASIEQIESWLDSGSNIALIPGASNLVAVDVDFYKGVELPQMIIDLLNSTPLVQETPRGGKHYIFSTKLDDGSEDVIFRDIQKNGIDIKANGYILVAPSHIDSSPYKWISWGQAPAFPRLLYDYLYASATITHEVQENPNLDRLARAAMDSLTQPATLDGEDGLELLESVLKRGFKSGEHNRQLRDLARLLYRSAFGESDKVRFETLMTILKALDERDPTPQGENLVPTVKQAFTYEHKRLAERGGLRRTAPQSGPAGLNGAGVVPAAPLQMVHFDAVLGQYENYNVEFAIEDWLPKRALLMMSAPPESYKTWMLLDMAVTLAIPRATGFLNTYKSTYTEPAPVIIVQQEDFMGLVAQRLRTLVRAKTRHVKWETRVEEDSDGKVTVFYDSPYMAPIYLHTESKVSLTQPETILRLQERVQEIGAQYVFVDPFYSLTGATSNYFADAAQQLQLFRELRNKTGAGVLIAHHSKKNREGATRARDATWGSQLMLGAFEGIISAMPVANKTVQLERSGKFYENTLAVEVGFNIKTAVDEALYETTVNGISGISMDNRKSKHDDEITAYLMENDGSSITKIATDLDVNPGTVKRRLDKLVDDGVLLKNNRRYYLSEATKDSF